MLTAKPHSQNHRQGGFTLVEIMISLTVLTAAVYLLSSTITATMAHSSKRKERTIAMESIMNVLEDMRSVPFRDLSVLYNDVDSDDPGGSGSAPGHRFSVPELDYVLGGVTTLAGTITLPTIAGLIREDVVLPELGMPRDLNGDFVADASNHTGDYMILPVTVKVEWPGSAGLNEMKITSMFSAIQKDLR